MDTLNYFVNLITGKFDNKKQFDSIKEIDSNYPYARHINTVLNDKINNLPNDFKGIFIVEESYYEVNSKVRAMPHLLICHFFDGAVHLGAYDLPKGFNDDNFTYENIECIDFNELYINTKFTPIVFEEKDGVFKGASKSQFSERITFSLVQEFTPAYLKVSECMYNNDKRIFGLDEPIIYERVSE